MGKNLSKKICGECGYVHGSDDARAINRFSPDRPTLYVAQHSNVHRLTRKDAERDECMFRQEKYEKNK